MTHLGDITRIHGGETAPVDVVVGGSPCQDLSNAGKRAGLAGERSGLYMEQIRVIREMRDADIRRGRTGQFVRPRFMVWENVPGAFSSNGGEDFRAVLEEAARTADPSAAVPGPPAGRWAASGTVLGDGWSIAWRVLDAQFWGVPQRRRRIALVADFGGHAAPEILFVRKGVRGDTQPGEAAGEAPSAGAGGGADCTVARSLTARHDGSPCVDRGPNIVLQTAAFMGGQGAKAGGVGYTVEASPTLKSTPSGSNTVPCVIKNHGQGRPADLLPFDSTQITSPKNRSSTHYGDMCHPLTAEGRPPSIILRQHNFGEYRDGNGTLTEHNGTRHTGETLVVEQDVRRLTPLECERLQGYPDGWTKLEPIETMTEELRRFWMTVLFEKAKREGTARLNTGGVWEVWRYITGNHKSFDPDHELDEDGGYWENTYKPYKHKTLSQMVKWYNRSFCTDSDSARYKALGNSIALPPWRWVLLRITACYERPATLGSLFDGIGGFPLIWERLNGPGTALWASEIEEFPIAVTKKHFG